MVDLRADTASSSDKAEVTETEDQSRTHHGSTLGTDPSGKAAQREGLKTVFGGTDAQEGAKMLQERKEFGFGGGVLTPPAQRSERPMYAGPLGVRPDVPPASL